MSWLLFIFSFHIIFPSYCSFCFTTVNHKPEAKSVFAFVKIIVWNRLNIFLHIINLLRLVFGVFAFSKPEQTNISSNGNEKAENEKKGKYVDSWTVWILDLGFLNWFLRDFKLWFYCSFLCVLAWENKKNGKSFFCMFVLKCSLMTSFDKWNYFEALCDKLFKYLLFLKQKV